jgi:hypothetical protein
MDLAGVAPQDDLTLLLLLLHLFHIQSSYPKIVIYSCRWGREEIVGVGRALSTEAIVAGYQASRMVRGLGDRLADACSGWELDMLRMY